jgi:hypothetical protein
VPRELLEEGAVMDWFNDLGAYCMLLNQAPPLAVDMTVNGPKGDFGFHLANSIQRTPTELNAYPPEEMDFTGLSG